MGLQYFRCTNIKAKIHTSQNTSMISNKDFIDESSENYV